jgi:hypothetical protein
VSNSIPLTDFSTVSVPTTDNELSSRFLGLVAHWVPVALRYYQPWSDRPDCGHFFGGTFAYGLDTSMCLTSLALVAASPNYAPVEGQPSAEHLRRIVRRSIRYLCFTHDMGPSDCVRPSEGPSKPGTKWGERGLGFFRESQCGRTLAEITFAAAHIHESLEDEEREILAAIAADYLDRFGMMPPKSGVYNDTQTEENAWTALGLVACLLLVPDHPQSDEIWESTKRWMFCTNTRPEDMFDTTVFADGKTVRELCRKTFTAHPDGTAENHGFVHPSYMGSGVGLPGKALNLLNLFNHPAPPHLLWRMRDIYNVLKSWCDHTGAPQAIQGMDWPYYNYPNKAFLHTTGNLHLGDPDAALLERRTLETLERSSTANGGRMVTQEVIDNASYGARSSLLGERMSDFLAQGALAHRLHGVGQTPSDPSEMESRLSGVTVYPQGGALVHRHTQGVSSFSWRNRVMVLPAPREGLKFLGAADRSLLAHIQVAHKSNRSEQVALKIRENADSASAAFVQDLCEGTVRRTACFASMPDGKTLTAEWLTALEDITVESLHQGTLSIINDGYFGEHPEHMGLRKVHHVNGEYTFEGHVTGIEEDSQCVQFEGAEWLNIDDRYGIVFRGSTGARYENWRAFSPWRAVENTLTLNPLELPIDCKPGDQISHLVTLCCPGQAHGQTLQQSLETESIPGKGFVAKTDAYTCAFALTNDPVRLQGIDVGDHDSTITRNGIG